MISSWTDQEFAAYLAAFTDGEGYIGIEPTTRKNVTAVRITLANSHLGVLVGLQKRLGYGMIRSQKRPGNWHEMFTLTMQSLSDAERFLTLVEPYLIVKKDVASRAMDRIAESKLKFSQRQSRNEAIRQLAASGKMRRAIAAEFGISPQLVSRVCVGHKWPSVQKELARVRCRDTRGLFVPVRSQQIVADGISN